jgi:hypothetical protein
VPNRHLLTENSQVRRAKYNQQLHKRRGTSGLAGAPSARVSVGSVLVNWAALVALWALPYLTLIDHLHMDAARSEALQWSLLIIGALGLVSVLHATWRETLDPAWRARQGLPPRKRTDRPHTENVA